MGLFDDITGGISDVAGKAADIGKKAASEAKTFVGGANQVYQLPGIGTVKSAISGNRGAQFQVAAAAAAVIPVGKVLGGIKFAPEAAGEERGLSAMARRLSGETGWLKSPEDAGSGFAAAGDVAESAKKAARGSIPSPERVAAAHANVPTGQMLTTLTSPVKGASSSLVTKSAVAAPASEEGVSALIARAHEDVATGRAKVAGFYEKLKGGEEGKLVPGKIAQFPDSVSNMARRVKTTVMNAITMTDPLEGKIAAVKSELAGLDRRSTGAAQIKTDFENNRITDFAKAAAKKALKGGEQGWIRASLEPKHSSGTQIMSRKRELTNVLRFGPGTYAQAAQQTLGESVSGVKTTAPKDFYEAHIEGSKVAGAVKVGWLGKHGSVSMKDVQPELKAISLGLKARGISAIEHEPLSNSRSRLFERLLKPSGFKNIDRNAPDIRRAGWGVR